MYPPTVEEIRGMFNGVGYDLADPRRGTNRLYTAAPLNRQHHVATSTMVGRGRTAREAAENAWQLFERGRALAGRPGAASDQIPG